MKNPALALLPIVLALGAWGEGVDTSGLGDVRGSLGKFKADRAQAAVAAEGASSNLPSPPSCTRDDLQMNNLAQLPEAHLGVILNRLCKKGGCGSSAPKLRYVTCNEVEGKLKKEGFDPQCLIGGSPALAIAEHDPLWTKDDNEPVIFVTPMIWMMVGTADQVAFTLAHEVAHVTEKHGKQALQYIGELYSYFREKRGNEGVNTNSWPLVFDIEAFSAAAPAEIDKFYKQYVPQYLPGKKREFERVADRMGLGTVTALGVTPGTAYSGKCAMEAMAQYPGLDASKFIAQLRDGSRTNSTEGLPLALWAIEPELKDITHDSFSKRAADLGRQGDSILEASRSTP